MTMRIHGDKIEFPDGTEQFTASTGGGGDAQPPVAFSVTKSASQVCEPFSNVKITFDTKEFDSNSDFDSPNTKFQPNKAGVYQINATIRLENVEPDKTFLVKVFKNDVEYTRIFQTNQSTTEGISNSGSVLVEMDGVNDYLELVAWHQCADSKDIRGEAYTRFSGHMISSITEGEVKEKEAVVFRAKASAPQTFSAQAWEPLENIDEVTIDTNNFYKDGKFTPTIAGYYEVNVTANFTTTTGDIIAGIGLNDKLPYSLGSYLANGGYGVNHTDIVYLNGVDDYVIPAAYAPAGKETNHKYCSFSAHLITGQSSGGSGGSYTPEKMVWEEYPIGADPVTERNFNTLYTNTNDVPLYLNIKVTHTSNGIVHLHVDGVSVSCSGSGLQDTLNYETLFYVVPPKSTYSLKQGSITGSAPDGIGTFSLWQEAKMPVAVGTGGKTVAFRGELTSKQTGVKSEIATKVNLDRTSFDTDNALVDGKFKPSVAGWYQVNGSIGQSCAPNISTNTASFIYKNGLITSQGCQSVTQENNPSSTVSDVVYLDGKDDYLELYGLVTCDGDTGGFFNAWSYTYLSAVLVSGGSASGDSIWTEEDGNAVYDGSVVLNDDTSPNVLFKSGGDEKGYIRTMMPFESLQLNGKGGMILSANSIEGLKLGADGTMFMPNIPDTSGVAGNLRITGSGEIKRTLDSTYTAKEVDNKLAIKDKLIEKLSARLDELEKRVK